MGYYFGGPRNKDCKVYVSREYVRDYAKLQERLLSNLDGPLVRITLTVVHIAPYQ